MNGEHHVTGQSRAFARRGDASTGGVSSCVRGLPKPERAVGEVLAGKYQIVGRLGAGGMGTVWRARSLWLDVDVAIKVLHEEQFDAHAAERLLREARATARLGHPAIVRVFDFGETDSGEPFLVMELLEGTSLSNWLEANGRMPAAQAVQMLLPVACALAAAHAQSIVHRDIKPANILVVPDGAGGHVPKVVDFGIAKLANVVSPAITQRGMIVGSPEYMSPEQADGQLEVGEQTDVWAFSVVLYELITGQRPFTGESLGAVISAIFNKEPVPTTQLGAGDEELWSILRRGLAKSPAERWPTMRSLGRALASWAVARGVTADVAGTSLAHQWLARGPESPLTAERPALATTGVAGAVSEAKAKAAAPRLRGAGKTLVASPAAAATPAGRRGGTIKMSEGLPAAPIGLAPPLRLQKALLVGVLVAFVAPVVVVMGLNLRGGSASAGAARPAVAAAAPVLEPGAALALPGATPAAPPADVVPAEDGGPRASALEVAARGAPAGKPPAKPVEPAEPWDDPTDPWGELADPWDEIDPSSAPAEPPAQRVEARPQRAEAHPQRAEPRKQRPEPRAQRAEPPRPAPASTSMPLPAAPDF
ncbi:protein kinase domain-containing protein [Sorangium sp. So ce542]|uniref:serine/threonine-protein kinase n=1 Tax=Sorangium sp. So ce542 TaxID=3133316 RepID=UPI003F642F9B